MRLKRGLAAALGLLLWLLASPPLAVQAAACASLKGPVGDAFLDCAGGQVRNVLPPGSDGLVNAAGVLLPPPHQQDQRPMYMNLEQVAPNLSAQDLSKYYKLERFGAADGDVDRVDTPRPGTAIVWDKSFGVPHIYGQTRYDAEFGAGYAAARDRLFAMDILRHVGRSETAAFLGYSADNAALDCSTAAVAGYSESELQGQLDKLPSEFPARFRGNVTEGQQIVADGTAYIDGVNAYVKAALANPALMPAEYAALQETPLPWKPTDIIAVATIVEAIFASGGGNEVQSGLLYQSLVQRYGQTEGAAIWRDLRSQNDPEAPTTIDTAFPYETGAGVDPKAVAMPGADPTSDFCNQGPLPAPNAGLGQTSLGPFRVDLRHLLSQRLHHMSNALLVGASKSADGHPLAVFGPQVAYFAPEILHEMDIHGPGLDARGSSFPGTDIYVELGRGVDYAWSATSAGSDLVDERMERLCNMDGSAPSAKSTAYVFNGKCTPMYERTDREVAKPTPAAPQGGVITIQIERTVHGPVIGRTTAPDPATGKQVPVAISYQRSTWFDELSSAPAFLEWNDPDFIKGPRDFMSAAMKETGTFNWFYADAGHTAYFSSGRLPVRAPGVDPNFPSWGTGEWEWRGWLAAAGHPQAVDPGRGWMTNWNNKPAPQFSAADSNFAYGPVYRVQALSDRLSAALAKGPVRPVDVVNAMEYAGSIDLDGWQDWPSTAQVLASPGPALTSQQASAVSVLNSWAAGESHRLSHSNPNGYDEGAAVAIMDAFYPRLTHAVFDPWLDSGQYKRLSEQLLPINNPPGFEGSAYDGGWEGYLQRSLRQALNPAIANGYSQAYCGSGSLAACRAAVLAALQAALDQLTKAYGNPDPSSWTCNRSNSTKAGQCNPSVDDIQFEALGLEQVANMPWVNRPTFQQVVDFPAHR